MYREGEDEKKTRRKEVGERSEPRLVFLIFFTLSPTREPVRRPQFELQPIINEQTNKLGKSINEVS